MVPLYIWSARAIARLWSEQSPLDSGYQRSKPISDDSARLLYRKWCDTFITHSIVCSWKSRSCKKYDDKDLKRLVYILLALLQYWTCTLLSHAWPRENVLAWTRADCLRSSRGETCRRASLRFARLRPEDDVSSQKCFKCRLHKWVGIFQSYNYSNLSNIYLLLYTNVRNGIYIRLVHVHVGMSIRLIWTWENIFDVNIVISGDNLKSVTSQLLWWRHEAILFPF